MTPTETDANRLIELLSKGWDDTLTNADNDEINDFLRAYGHDGGLLLLNACAVHLELGKHVASTQVFEEVMEFITNEITTKQDAQAHRDAVPRRSAVGLRSGKHWGTLAIAAALLVSVSLNLVDWNPVNQFTASPPQLTRLFRPTKPVANLVAVNQAVWAEGSEVEVGENIEEKKRLHLVSGTAQLSMACGADIVLQAPCTLTLVANDSARLESGKLTAQAATWATGFSVEARSVKVTDLGTRFAVSADESGVVEAHVLEGSVLAEALKDRRPDPSSVLLRSGQAIRVDGVRSKVDLIKARSGDFAGKIEQFRPLRRVPIWNTGVGSGLGSEDPHWRISQGSEAFGPFPRQATVTDGDTGSYKDNKSEVSQWISVAKEGYPGVPPKSTHTFETTFDLTGFDTESVYIVGYFLVDDAINQLRINGHPVKYKRWVTTWDEFDFKSFHPIEIVDHFVPGENVISIDVFNSPSRPETPKKYNPTALRVEWQAFGRPLPG